MTKKQLVSLAAKKLKEQEIKKTVPPQKSTLYVSDEEGNKKKFTFQKEKYEVDYNYSDVMHAFNAIIDSITDCIQKGKTITIHGFGTFSVIKHKPRVSRHPVTKELYEIGARYVPKFDAGETLRIAGRMYQRSLDGTDSVLTARILDEDTLEDKYSLKYTNKPEDDDENDFYFDEDLEEGEE